MAQKTKVQQQKPLPFPPTVKGWWEYRGGEPGIEYNPIAHYEGGELNAWDFIKYRRIEAEPQNDLLVLFDHEDAPIYIPGWLQVRQDESLQLITLRKGKVVLHFSCVDRHKVKLYPILGLVKLPKKGRNFVEKRYKDVLPNDPGYLKDQDETFTKFQKQN